MKLLKNPSLLDIGFPVIVCQSDVKWLLESLTNGGRVELLEYLTHYHEDYMCAPSTFVAGVSYLGIDCTTHTIDEKREILEIDCEKIKHIIWNKRLKQKVFPRHNKNNIIRCFVHFECKECKRHFYQSTLNLEDVSPNYVVD